MTRMIPLVLAALLAAAPAKAACYADYKAKQDNPLQLHYGVIELPEAACDPTAAVAEVDARLGDGWILLEIVSIFGDEGLQSRRDRASDYFLRY